MPVSRAYHVLFDQLPNLTARKLNISHMPMGCPREPPKTFGIPCVSAWTSTEDRKWFPKSANGFPKSFKTLGKQIKSAFQRSRESYNLFGDMPMPCGPASKFHVVRQSLTAEKLGNQTFVGKSFNGIGFVYFTQGSFEKALDYINRSLKIFKDINDKEAQTITLHLLTRIHSLIGTLDKAFDYNMSNLEISKEIEDEKGVRTAMVLLSQLYWRKGDLNKAIEIGMNSLEIAKNQSWEGGKCYPLGLIGLFYLDKGDYDTAIEYLEESVSILKADGNKDILFAIKYLFLAYKKLGKQYDEDEIHTLKKIKIGIEELLKGIDSLKD